MNEFFVGQRVVCIASHFNDMEPGEVAPVLDGIYTIRCIEWCEGRVGLKFSEIHNPKTYLSNTEDCCFTTNKFRPLESKAIQLFRKIARDVTEGKTVELVS